MSVTPSEFHAKYSSWKLSCLCVLALLICASSAWGAAPAVVIDAQQTIGSGYSSPQALAVNKTNQSAIFIADTGNNQIVALLTNGFNFAFQPPGFTLSGPQAVALDAKGDLFIGDTPTSGGTSSGRVIEMPADASGNLAGTAQVVFSGAPLTNPIAMTVDSAGTLFIADFPASGPSAIYSLAAGGTTPQLLNITGVPSDFIPAALVRDSSTNLYFADNASANGGVYIVPAGGGAAQPIATGSFVIDQPSGLALDAAGDLFILSQLGNGSGFNPGQQVVIVPAASPATPYILPNTGLGTSSSMAFDPKGNLNVVESASGNVVQFAYVNPVDLGHVNVGQAGAPIPFNFEFNAPTTLNGFRFVTQGDVGTEITQAGGGNCTNGAHNTLPNGGPTISPYFPYTCLENYEGTPAYPGLRTSAIQVRGPSSTILASAPVFQTAYAGVEITYPLNSSITAKNLQQPQAIAISGLNKKVYTADTQAGVVYSSNGLGGTALTPLPTGSITLQAPSALALDGAGDLFIADFNLGEVIKVPTATGQAVSVVNVPAGLLQHPIALAFDNQGNLYIGDTGPGGVDAGNGNPGFVVKLPAGGTAFKMTIPSIPIVFPQALVANFYTGDLYIGDGGDPSGAGQVVHVSADGSSADILPISDVTNPTGLAFDANGSLYILDGVANTITVDEIYQSAIPPFLLDFTNSSLSGASALAISAGGQSFLIANIGSGSTNNLVLVNGNRSTLSFGNVLQGNQSQTKTAKEYNIGNLPLTLAAPYYTTNTPNAAFSILGSSTCGDNVVLQTGTSCSINVQFTPLFTGHTTQQITVKSDGYNSGVPILTVQGTGVAPASQPAKAAK
jgi:sugar lactone lactonase YvrE